MKYIWITFFAIATIGIFSACETNPQEPANDPIPLPIVNPDNENIVIEFNGKTYTINIPDKTLSDGTLLSDKIEQLLQESRNRGQFIMRVIRLLNELYREGIITRAEWLRLLQEMIRLRLP